VSYDTITVTQAKPQREANEGEYTGPDGTRSAMLIRVSDPVTEPSTMGKKSTWTHRTWFFAIDDQSEFDGQVLDSRISVTSSNSDKSKQYEAINALAGKTVPVGVELSISRHLVNRSCYIRIESNDNGFPVIRSFMAKPETGSPVQAPAPAARAESPVAAPADMPF